MNMLSGYGNANLFDLTQRSPPRQRLALPVRPPRVLRDPSLRVSQGDLETYLKVGLSKAPGDSDHGGSEWARDADGGQKLRNVGCEAKRDRTVGI